MAQKQATRTNQAITLKGSTALVTEFFEYSVNRCVSIGSEGSVDSQHSVSTRCLPVGRLSVGPFGRSTSHQLMDSMVKKYGLPMLVTSDEGLKEYLSTILSQVQGEAIFHIGAPRLFGPRRFVRTGCPQFPSSVPD